MSEQLGIDLGSHFCRFVWATEGSSSNGELSFRDAHLPSVVHNVGGQLRVNEPLAGESPKENALHYGTAKSDLDANRRILIGENIFSSMQIAETFLRAPIAEAREGAEASLSRVVVAYPPIYDIIAQDNLKQSAINAGIANITVISEAVAAVWAARHQEVSIGKCTLVCDLGSLGATVSVVASTVDGDFETIVAPRFIVDSGGDAIDQSIYNHVLTAEANDQGSGYSVGRIDAALLLRCRLWKESFTPNSNSDIENTWTGMDVQDLKGLAKKGLESAHRAMLQAVQEATARGNAVDSAILVGGGAKLPFIHEILGKDITPTPVIVPQPDQAVALGCALYGIPSNAPVEEQLSPIASKEFTEFVEKYERDARARPLVLLLAGRTGVGKSSTVNSLMGRVVAPISHSKPCTFDVRTYDIDIQGIKIQVVDTPGLCDEPVASSNDDYYIQKMRDAIGQIDALLYVTDLQKRPPDSDELRALRVLSKAFERKGDIWRTAVIVFTHANTSSLTLEVFQERMQARTRDFHNLIAGHTGETIANAIPIVAVENTADTTLDGKDWRAELYTQVCLRVANEGFATWVFATIDRTTTQSGFEQASTRSGSLWKDEDYGRRESTLRRGSHSTPDLRLSEEQAGAIRERLRNDFVQKFESGGRAIGSAVGLGDLGASIGRTVGSWISKWF